MEANQQMFARRHGIGPCTTLIRLVGLMAIALHLTGCGPAAQTTSNAAPSSTTGAITVTPGTGSATLIWTAPTKNSDGTPLTDLAGFHVHYGTSASALTQSIEVSGATSTTYVVHGLSAGTYYFAVSAYNSLGIDSALSNIASNTL